MANGHSEPAIRVSNWTLATNTVPWQRAIATADAQITPARSGRSSDPGLRSRRGELDLEDRSTARPVLRADRTAVTHDDLLRDGEPESQVLPAIAARTIREEPIENPFEVSLWDAGTTIRDRQEAAACDRLERHLDCRVRRREFACVRQQILECLRQALARSPHGPGSVAASNRYRDLGSPSEATGDHPHELS